MWLGEAVVDRAGLGTAGDQAAVFEDGHVGGDAGLGAAEFGGQVGDAPFAVLEGEQNGQPGRLGQGAEERGGLLCGRGGWSGRGGLCSALLAGPDTSGACSIARTWMSGRSSVVSSVVPRRVGCIGLPGAEAWYHVVTCRKRNSPLTAADLITIRPRAFSAAAGCLSLAFPRRPPAASRACPHLGARPARTGLRARGRGSVPVTVRIPGHGQETTI
jgi:hypothetical protein